MAASTDFNGAINTYSVHAKKMFDAGSTYLGDPSPPASAPTDPERTSRAQGYISSGFSQLGQAAQFESAQIGRDGYAALADLMKTTAACAKVVCTQIQTLVGSGGPTAANIPILNALNDTLKSLAQISPASVWTTSAST